MDVNDSFHLQVSIYQTDATSFDQFLKFSFWIFLLIWLELGLRLGLGVWVGVGLG
jgi:hypothetical protein